MLSKNSIVEMISKSRQDSLKLISRDTTTIKNSLDTIANLLERDDLVYGTMLNDDITHLNLPLIRSELGKIYAKYHESFSQMGVNFYFIFIAENGFTYSSKPNYTDFDFNKIKSMSWFSKNIAIMNDSYFVTNFNDFTKDGQDYFSIGSVKNFRSSSDKYVGSLLVCMDERNFSNSYSNLISASNSIFILDELSRVISHSNPNLIGTVPFELRDYKFTRSDQTYKIMKVDHTDYLYSKFYSPSSGWTIVESIPLSRILAPLNQLVLRIIVIAIFLCLVGIYMAFFLSKNISQPLFEFCQNMKRFINRNLEEMKMKEPYLEIHQLCAGFNEMNKEIKQLLVDVKNKEQLVQKAKLDFLRAQINPHFLYNTLFSIKCTVAMKKNESACEMLTILISLLKDSIGSDSEYIPLINEIKYIKDYVKLQKLRYGNNLETCINIPPYLMNTKILRFILQPIVENCIIHGIEPNSGVGIIGIEVSEIPSGIQINISDNGVGIDKEIFYQNLNRSQNDSSDKSIGLSNIHNRILLNYGKQYGLNLDENVSVGTCIQIKLPKME